MRDQPSGFHPKRRWGQNFLVNEGAADHIVAAFAPRAGDFVLEVGPGRGTLTRRLLGRVGRLVAVEVDPLLADDLRQALASPPPSPPAGGTPAVEIVGADILEIDLEALLLRLGAAPGHEARVLANLPYNIATAVILRLLEHGALLRDLMVMVQREVAERLRAAPGGRDYGSLSVLCQARARVEMILRLRPGSFRPVPRVESEVVRLTLLPSAAAPGPGPAAGAAPTALARLLRAAFAQRRKTLLNNLSRLRRVDGAPLGTPAAGDLIRAAGLRPGMRPEEVPVSGFLELAGRL
jgi:16S rRNA (adenine1518-N6/adenine1519-N6)-dimethyltransferase